MVLHLVGAAEAAEVLGVTRQRLAQLVEHADFPRPVAVLAAGRIWLRADIERWQERHKDRRPGRPSRTRKNGGKP